MLLYKTDINIYYLPDSVGVVWVCDWEWPAWVPKALVSGVLSSYAPCQNIPTSVQTEPRVNATVEVLISILSRLSILGMTAGMSWQLTSPSSKSLIRDFTHIQKDSGKELFWHESQRCAHCNTKLTLTCQCLYRANYLLLACYLTCSLTVRELLIKTQRGLGLSFLEISSHVDL